jgi:hypothetical protein
MIYQCNFADQLKMAKMQTDACLQNSLGGICLDRIYLVHAIVLDLCEDARNAFRYLYQRELVFHHLQI